ncbi:MAG: hypothetical protein RI995_953 [Bacteroidota bacterium]|jgi:hypothetical protein
MKKVFLTLSLMLFTTVAAFCADINGKWVGKIMDQYDISFTFKVDGGKLTGTTKDPSGQDVEISNGTIDGDKIKFTIDVMGSAVEVNGTLASDILKMKMNVMNNDLEFDLKKSL